MAEQRQKLDSQLSSPLSATPVKTIASLKGISVSEWLNRAIEVYLPLPEIQKLVERHRLDEIEED